jgi:hypothetical protein
MKIERYAGYSFFDNLFSLCYIILNQIRQDSFRGKMLQKKEEVLVYLKASDCFECLNHSLEHLQKIKNEESESNEDDLYRARKFLNQGESCFKETLKNCKRLLGPIPDYASDEYYEWKDEILKEDEILAHGEDLKSLTEELEHDELLRKWMSQEEIDSFLNTHFESQQTGNRKLVNIKARLIIHKLDRLLQAAKKMQREVIQKFNL